MYAIATIEQSNKLIKIQSKDGMFGFSAPFEFTSVVALIQKHQRESLVQFNPELNIRLLYPLSKEVSKGFAEEKLPSNDRF